MIDLLQTVARLLVAILLGVGCAAAASAAPPTAASAQGSEQDYRIGPGDVLKITTFRSPELSLETQVSEDGKISFPLLGTVDVGGKSPFSVAKSIEQQLREGKFFSEPQVSVLVAQHRSKIVSINGHVARPGRYPIETGQLRLSELIALAGGILPSGSDEVVILRDAGAESQRLTVTLSTLFTGDAASANDPLVVGGDRVFVDKAPRFYIYGEVQRPGEYELSRNLTVGQAIALGGGVTPRGNKKNVRVYRSGSSKRKGISAELSSEVRPNDEIVVQERIF